MNAVMRCQLTYKHCGVKQKRSKQKELCFAFDLSFWLHINARAFVVVVIIVAVDVVFSTRCAFATNSWAPISMHKCT